MLGDEATTAGMEPSAALLQQYPKPPKVVASVIFFVNPSSGGHKGTCLLKQLRAAGTKIDLGQGRAVKLTAFDISLWAVTTASTDTISFPPWTELQESLLVQGGGDENEEMEVSILPSVVIAAGGDGTFQWAVDILRNPQVRQGLVKSQELPLWPSRFVPLPLGTGNELANVMGWKTALDRSNYCCCLRRSKLLIIPDLNDYLREVLDNPVVPLDEWQVTETSSATASGLPSKTTVHSMLCFVSVGIDAKIAYQFAQIRDGKAKWRTSKVWLNKAIHAWYGFKNIISPHESIEQRVKLMVELNDGNSNTDTAIINDELIPLDIPHNLQNVSILNIASGADGAEFWGGLQPSRPDEFPASHQCSFAPSPSDGKLEVCGLRNVFPHLAATKVGLQHSHRLAQTSLARVQVLKAVPVQLDGEPWMLNEGDTLLIQPRPRPPEEDIATTAVNVVQGPDQTRTQTLERSSSSESFNRLTLALQRLGLRAKGTLLPTRRRQEEGAAEISHSESAARTTDNSSLRQR